MIEPATYFVEVLGEAGEEVLPRFATPATLPGIPRVGDDVKVVDGTRRVIRVLWQANIGNSVELWTTMVEPDTMWCPLHQHHKWCEHNGGVLGDTGYEASPS
jgi:hypothetical protein